MLDEYIPMASTLDQLIMRIGIKKCWSWKKKKKKKK
jgi:hypothetical protein